MFIELVLHRVYNTSDSVRHNCRCGESRYRGEDGAVGWGFNLKADLTLTLLLTVNPVLPILYMLMSLVHVIFSDFLTILLLSVSFVLM